MSWAMKRHCRSVLSLVCRLLSGKSIRKSSAGKIYGLAVRGWAEHLTGSEVGVTFQLTRTTNWLPQWGHTTPHLWDLRLRDVWCSQYWENTNHHCFHSATRTLFLLSHSEKRQPHHLAELSGKCLTTFCQTKNLTQPQHHASRGGSSSWLKGLRSFVL